MKWFLNRLTSLQGKKCLLISIEGMAKLWGCWGWVCFSALSELVFVLSTLLNWSAESKVSAVSVFPVVIETRPKCDKWLCHSAEKQNRWQGHQIPSGFGVVCFYWLPTPHSPVPPPKRGSTWCFLSVLLPCRKCLALGHPECASWKCQKRQRGN